MDEEEEEDEVCLASQLPPREVRLLIENFIKNFLQTLFSETPSIKDLNLVKKSSKTIQVFHESKENARSQQPFVSSNNFFRRNFFQNNGKSAHAFLRVWLILEKSYSLLKKGKVATQREIFYNLLTQHYKYFSIQNHVNNAIQDVVSTIRCSRCSLGMYASSKGLVVGHLKIRIDHDRWIDCMQLGSSGMSITGNIRILEKFEFESDARYIFVIEKDAIFQRVCEDKLFVHVPCIVLTAKGFPDLASRIFLHKIHKAYPHMLILGLVDWNPSGLSILCNYKFGSIRMALESPKYVVDLKWLGIRYHDIINHVQENAKKNLSHRQCILAENMSTSELLKNHAYKEELDFMLKIKKSVEIEALYSNGYRFLVDFIIEKLVKKDYV